MGGLTGVMAIDKKSELDDSEFCRDGQCEPEAHGDVDALDTLRTLSTVGFIVGVAGAGVGVGLLIAGHGDAEGRALAKTALRLGPGHLSLTGTIP
jgi:hypothetical protein